MTTKSESSPKMKGRTRFELGVMAGLLASVVMGITIIVITTIGELAGYPWPIQFYVWFGSIFGATGTPVGIGEMGVAWFVGLSIIAGLIFAFGFKAYDIYEGLVLGGISLFLVGLYMTIEVAPSLSGTILTMPLDSSLAVLFPLAVCFGLWGLTMGYFGERYLH